MYRDPDAHHSPRAVLMARKHDPLYCSFCGKSQHEVSKLIAGPTVFICDECVDLCVDIVIKKRQEAFLFSHDMTVGDDSK